MFEYMSVYYKILSTFCICEKPHNKMEGSYLVNTNFKK